MAIIVEDGGGKADAVSYLSASDFKGYADARGLSYDGMSDAQIEQSLVRGTAWIDSTYRSRWPGVRLNGRAQALAWPRSGAVDADGEEIAADEIPSEVLDATAEAAYRELNSPGGLAPDLERGGAITKLQAGSVAVEYSGVAPATTTFTMIDGILASILAGGGQSSDFTARAVRA